MNLNDKEWKQFCIADLFNVEIGKNVDGNKVDKSSGKRAYITRKESNNGLDGFIDNDKAKLNIKFPVITIGNETAKPFVQVFPFYTGTKVNILEPIESVSASALQFIAISLQQHKNKYNYSYTINSTRLKKQIILLPITKDGKPDYLYMEEVVNSYMDRGRNNYKGYAKKMISKLSVSEIPKLHDKEWKEFNLTKLFTSIQRGKRLTKANHIVGRIPYVSSSAMNNGVDNYISNTKKVRKFSNCLSIANSGSVGSSFYHPYEFIASDHITHLKNENMNMFVYIFLATMTNRFKEKYNFNREINDKRICREKIMLPINSEGEPDYIYMEQYIKNIMISKYKQYSK
ncbi:hypothetical protein JCM1393_12860 [Clostridium carnis]